MIKDHDIDLDRLKLLTEYLNLLGYSVTQADLHAGQMRAAVKPRLVLYLDQSVAKMEAM